LNFRREEPNPLSAETILVVDDEAMVRTYVRTILRREGFQLIEAVDGLDALEQVEQRGSPDLLLTDVRMPRMDGIALARAITQAHPKTPVIYISGYAFEPEGKDRPGECAFVSKPFTRAALLDAVTKCLHPPRTASGGAA
jgi:two-component system cell cycle sensor histidine kinase/response regulator CckA